MNIEKTKRCSKHALPRAGLRTDARTYSVITRSVLPGAFLGLLFAHRPPPSAKMLPALFEIGRYCRYSAVVDLLRSTLVRALPISTHGGHILAQSGGWCGKSTQTLPQGEHLSSKFGKCWGESVYRPAYCAEDMFEDHAFGSPSVGCCAPTGRRPGDLCRLWADFG